jgi:hypothetical protein
MAVGRVSSTLIGDGVEILRSALAPRPGDARNPGLLRHRGTPGNSVLPRRALALSGAVTRWLADGPVRRWVDRVTGLILIGFGARLAVEP